MVGIADKKLSFHLGHMAEQSNEHRQISEGLPSESPAHERGTTSTSLTDMFSLLLQEMKHINTGISAFQDSRHFDEELEDISLSADEEGPVEPEQQDVDLESIDTRVNKLVENQTKSNPNPDILTNIAQEFAIKENTGEEVNESLAGIVSSLVTTRLSEDKLKQKLQYSRPANILHRQISKYPRPANIEGLTTPRINPLIWGQISSSTQQSDAKSQKAQHTLIGAASAIVKSVDHVLKTDSSNKELITMLTDALAFVLQCNHDTNHSRRLALKKDLHKDFAALCNVNTPAGEFLFGNLSKLTKEISDANKLAKKVRPPASTSRYKKQQHNQHNRNSHRYRPYTTAQSNQRSKDSFFEKGRFPTPRKKNNQSK